MKISKFNIMPVLLSGFLFLAPAVVFAGAESGIYIGGGLGDSSVKGTNFSESDSAYKLFGGFNFGVIPLIDLAVEASYVDFGTPADVTGLNAFGLAGLSFGPFGIFVKAGVVDWDTNFDSGTDSAYGVGARLQFGSLAVRLEYEEFDVSGLDTLDLTSASLVYTF